MLLWMSGANLFLSESIDLNLVLDEQPLLVVEQLLVLRA